MAVSGLMVLGAVQHPLLGQDRAADPSEAPCGWARLPAAALSAVLGTDANDLV